MPGGSRTRGGRRTRLRTVSDDQALADRLEYGQRLRAELIAAGLLVPAESPQRLGIGAARSFRLIPDSGHESPGVLLGNYARAAGSGAMRLREMQRVLHDNLGELAEVVRTQPETIGAPQGNWSGWPKVSKLTVEVAIGELESIPALRKPARGFLQKHQDILNTAPSFLMVPQPQFKQIESSLARVVSVATAIRDFLDGVLGKPSDTEVALELPPVGRVADFAAVAKDLQLIFEQPYLERKGFRPNVAGFDRGSMHVVIELTTGEALMLIWILYKTAVDLIASKNAARQQVESVRSVTPEAATLLQKTFADVQVKYKEKLLSERSPSDMQPGERANLFKGVERLVDLLERGAELHLPPKPPENIPRDEWEEPKLLYADQRPALAQLRERNPEPEPEGSESPDDGDAPDKTAEK